MDEVLGGSISAVNNFRNGGETVAGKTAGQRIIREAVGETWGGLSVEIAKVSEKRKAAATHACDSRRRRSARLLAVGVRRAAVR
jgi:hypothetical protein